MNLQHLALVELSKSSKYPMDNPVVDNLVFEIGVIKDRLDREIVEQETEINDHLIDDTIDLSDYFDLTSDIHDTLFVVFNYRTVIKTDEHIQWKEYFNCLYEHCIIDYESEQMLWFTYRCFDMFEPPTDLTISDPCFIIVKTLKDLFSNLKDEHHRILGKLKPPNEYREYRIERGRNHLKMIQQRDKLVHLRDLYESVLEWST